ncbi:MULTISPECIES: hypothetical protein [Rhodopirellula]|uniref:hypothetical protein n=1 Tax=Rhodopirellula TaxID=265488 RepID=UPI00257A341E|nr:hypothetical protein [Rhodopirellula sp. UBA1907]MCR9207025.1 hypothetical protein [bacterium]
MGWAVGAGLAMLLLLALSVCASLLAMLRSFMRSEQTHFACILVPAIAAFIGFSVFAMLRLVELPTIAFETLVLGSIAGVGFGCLIGVMPLQTR